MKPIITNQEILLFTSTQFSDRELCGPADENKRLETNSNKVELEKACWAGMLFEMLPELTPHSLCGSKLFIWDILSADHFLLVNQGSYPKPIESETSVDPHQFLVSFQFN